jgi:hypothetical protein
MKPDFYDSVLRSIRKLNKKQRLKEFSGEKKTSRFSLTAEELSEVSACVTKGKGKLAPAEELADLLILLLGTGVAQDIVFNSGFWEKLEVLEKRKSRMVNGRIGVSEFQGVY